MHKSLLKKLWERGLLYAPDTSGGTGGNPDGQESKEESDQESEQDEKESQESQDDQKLSGVQSLPDWAQELIGGLRKENANHRQSKKKAEEDARKAEEKRLADQEEWKTLAEQRQARVSELEPLQEQMTALTERFATTFNDEIKDWPEEIKDLAPDGDVSVVQMLDWLDKHRPLAGKLMGSETGHPKGNAPRPKPKGQSDKRKPIEPVIDVRRMF